MPILLGIFLITFSIFQLLYIFFRTVYGYRNEDYKYDEYGNLTKKTIRIYKEGILCRGLYLREERIYCKNGKEIYIYNSNKMLNIKKTFHENGNPKEKYIYRACGTLKKKAIYNPNGIIVGVGIYDINGNPKEAHIFNKKGVLAIKVKLDSKGNIIGVENYEHNSNQDSEYDLNLASILNL